MNKIIRQGVTIVLLTCNKNDQNCQKLRYTTDQFVNGRK